MPEAGYGMRRGGKLQVKDTAVLADGKTLPKTDPVFEALGTMDELSAHLALLHAEEALAGEFRSQLDDSLAACFEISARLAGSRDVLPLAGRLTRLVAAHDVLFDARSGGFRRFCDNPLAARLDLVRTVCRRAERRLLALPADGQDCIYLDVLADWLFLAACRCLAE